MDKLCRGFVILISSCGLLMAPLGQAWSQQADPTEPPARVAQRSVPVQAEVRDLRLTSIWYRASHRDGDSVAVINGTRVKQGDQVGDYEVVRIAPEQVILKNEQGEVSLRVFRSNNLTIEMN